MLSSFCDNRYTDKNTVHSYIDVYEALFSKKRDTATHVLEIGIGPYAPNGGSIKMWAGYFPNAQIHTADVIGIDEVNPEIIDHPRIYLHTSNNAYNRSFVTNTFSSKDMKFDILIDDGPHTLESMCQFLVLYLPMLKRDGILVIEDIQSPDWLEILKACTPDNHKSFIQIHDRRGVKGRYDDIMFVIDRSFIAPPSAEVQKEVEAAREAMLE
jgi:hypothetical protein